MIDIRTFIVSKLSVQEFYNQLNNSLKELDFPPILFLTCKDEVLIRRLTKEGRSFHPLLVLGEIEITVEEAIKKEKELLKPLKDMANVVIDTSDTSIWGLRRKIFDIFSSKEEFSTKFSRYFLSDKLNYDQVLLDIGKDIVKKVITQTRQILLFDPQRCGEKVESLREKDPDDETRRIDLIAEQEYITSLENNVGVPYLLLTEEVGEIEVGQSNPDLLVFVDPIDGTDLGIRKIPLVATSICFYSRGLKEFLSAVVGDIFTGTIYYASKSKPGAFVEGVDFGPIRIFPSTTKKLEDAFVSSFTIKPQRLLAFLDKKELISRSLRIFSNGGPLEICRVASGDVDALVEFTKGYTGYDLFPGAYILIKAGGVCRRLDNKPLEVKADINYRQTFISAATEELFEELLKLINDNKKELEGGVRDESF